MRYLSQQPCAIGTYPHFTAKKMSLMEIKQIA